MTTRVLEEMQELVHTDMVGAGAVEDLNDSVWLCSRAAQQGGAAGRRAAARAGCWHSIRCGCHASSRPPCPTAPLHPGGTRGGGDAGIEPVKQHNVLKGPLELGPQPRRLGPQVELGPLQDIVLFDRFDLCVPTAKCGGPCCTVNKLLPHHQHVEELAAALAQLFALLK